MDLKRINELMYENDRERLSWAECEEIHKAYDLIPQEDLRDLKENATISDMLEELKDRATPLEKAVDEKRKYRAIAVLPDGTEVTLSEGDDYKALRDFVNQAYLGTKEI